MAKQSSLQIVPIDSFVNATYHVVKFYINITGCVRTTIYWFETFFIISLKKNIGSVKLFEASLVNNILSSFY